MKNCLLCILLLVLSVSSVKSFGQSFPIDPETERIVYSEVLRVKSASQYKLYVRANKWIARSFSASDILSQKLDRDNGEIVIKAKMPVEVPYFVGKIYAGNVYYQIRIKCYNQRFQYTISDFYHDDPDKNQKSGGTLENEITEQNFFTMPMHWDEIRVYVDDETRRQIDDLRRSMSKD